MTDDFYESLLSWRAVFEIVTPASSDARGYRFGIKPKEETTWCFPRKFEVDLTPGQINLYLCELQLEEKLLLEWSEDIFGEVLCIAFAE